MIYAEVAIGFSTRERFERVLGGVGMKRLGLPFGASWLVAQAFAGYRSAGGSRTVPLPEFFIGAHAAAAGLTCSRATRAVYAGTSRRSS